MNQERLIKRFMDYVQIDSETLNEGAFDDFLVSELEQLGFEVSKDDAGSKIGSNGYNIYAYKSGSIEAEPIAFSCHTDTVKPGIGIKPILEDGVIRSSGDTILASDDKAGIAAIMETMTELNETQEAHRPIEIIFTIAEEGGLRGAKNLEYSRIRSKKAIILDSSGSVGNIVVKAPAQDKIFATFKGKPAHAGIEPEKGISAIQVAAAAITKMNLLRIDEETTANIGTLVAESATNIVCPSAKFIGEARSLDNDKLKKQTDHMVACMKEAAAEFGTTVEVNVESMYSAFSIPADDAFLLEIRAILEALQFKVKLASTGGGSDANIFNQRGIKAINLGTGMTGAHTLEEHITVKDLTDLCTAVKAIACQA